MLTPLLLFAVPQNQQMILMARAAVAAAVLMWLQGAVPATGNPSPACQIPAGPEKMVVVKAPTPFFSWSQCNDLGNAGQGTFLTEAINETKHAGVVTTL